MKKALCEEPELLRRYKSTLAEVVHSNKIKISIKQVNKAQHLQTRMVTEA